MLEPFPLWYVEHAVLIARLMPVLAALALVVFNRLGEPRQEKAKAQPVQEKPLTFTTVDVPKAPRQQVPSAAMTWERNPERRKA